MREKDEEPAHLTVPIAHDGDGLGGRIPPLPQRLCGQRRLVPARDPLDGVADGSRRRLDSQGLPAAGEERLADDGIVDQVQHVGCAAP